VAVVKQGELSPTGSQEEWTLEFGVTIFDRPGFEARIAGRDHWCRRSEIVTATVQSQGWTGQDGARDRASKRMGNLLVTRTFPDTGASVWVKMIRVASDLGTFYRIYSRAP
jgi:hypothetical protein